MSGFGNEIKNLKPSNEDRIMVHVVVHAMKEVVASIHRSELEGRRWLLLDELMEIVGLYFFCYDQSAATEADQSCEDIKEQNENAASSVRLANNLLELHYNILDNVKDKLAPFIYHLLKVRYENKFHCWFYLFWDPRYAAYLKELR